MKGPQDLSPAGLFVFSCARLPVLPGHVQQSFLGAKNLLDSAWGGDILLRFGFLRTLLMPKWWNW